MCEKPKEDVDDLKSGEKNDKVPRSYYYDDAHGYEDYDPNDSDEQDDDEDELP